MREYGSSGNQVADILILWLDLVFLLIFSTSSAFGSSNKDLKPIPSVHFQFIHVLFDLGGLEGEPFGKHEAHPSPDTVCPYPFKIPMSFNLGFFGRVSVNADRAVSDYQADFVFGRSILKACTPLIK